MPSNGIKKVKKVPKAVVRSGLQPAAIGDLEAMCFRLKRFDLSPSCDDAMLASLAGTLATSRLMDSRQRDREKRRRSRKLARRAKDQIYDFVLAAEDHITAEPVTQVVEEGNQVTRLYLKQGQQFHETALLVDNHIEEKLQTLRWMRVTFGDLLAGWTYAPREERFRGGLRWVEYPALVPSDGDKILASTEGIMTRLTQINSFICDKEYEGIVRCEALENVDFSNLCFGKIEEAVVEAIQIAILVANAGVFEDGNVRTATLFFYEQLAAIGLKCEAPAKNVFSTLAATDFIVFDEIEDILYEVVKTSSEFLPPGRYVEEYLKDRSDALASIANQTKELPIWYHHLHQIDRILSDGAIEESFRRDLAAKFHGGFPELVGAFQMRFKRKYGPE